MQNIRLATPTMLALTGVWLIIFLTCFENPFELLQKNWIFFLVGIAGAYIGNITSIGGGLVFIPVLIFFYHLDPVKALKLAFVTQAIGMTSGAAGWIRRKEVPFSLLGWTVPALIIGTLVSTFLFHPQPTIVKGLFGPVSMIVGVLTLLTMKKSGEHDTIPSSGRIPVMIASFVGGLITGWVAIGEGEIIAAFCMLAYGLRSNKAIGLGVTLLSINSIILALIHSLYFGGVPWDIAIFTTIAVLWGARLAPYSAKWIPMKHIKFIFGIIALLDGGLIIFTVVRSLMK